jgi:alkaline phosphatase
MLGLACVRSCMLLALLTLNAPTDARPLDNDGSSRPAPGEPTILILMIADGAGFASIEAASHHASGAARSQVYWRFPVALAMSTRTAGGLYDPARAWTDADWLGRRATDSAAAITAMTTGIKVANGSLNVTGDGEHLTTLAALLQARGRAAGVVTTVQFSHATPAGFAISHHDRSHYPEIARKMLLESGLEVIMGAGHPEFDDDGRPRSDPDYKYVGGIDLWREIRAGTLAGDGGRTPWSLFESRQAILELATTVDPPHRVLALPRVHKTLQSKRGGDRAAAAHASPKTPDLPDLAELTLAALNVLSRSPSGFGLLVEGGAIDWAAHDRQPGRLIEEQQDFDRAVAAVVHWLDRHEAWDEALLIVTSDHECGHLCGPPDGSVLPPVAGRGQGAMPAFTIESAEHTNALVPFFARGSGAEALVGLATGVDPVRGAYLDIENLGAHLRGLVGAADEPRRAESHTQGVR